MKTTSLNFILIFTLFVSAKSQDFEKFPITKINASKNVIIYKTGLTSVYSNMIAVKTSNGVVVIDAHQYPEVARKIREMINSDFKDEVVYLINTHGAYDHTGGNLVFDNVPIFGSAGTSVEMQRFNQISKSPQFQSFIEQEMIIKPESSRDTYPGDKKEINESVESNKNLIKMISENSFSTIIPDTLFKDNYNLTVGKTEFKMYANTPSYSRSDIVIYIPEEKALIVGDIFNKNRLPMINRETNLEKWIALFDPFTKNDSDVNYFIGTHGDIISKVEIINQFTYLKKLFEEVKRLKTEGKSIEEVTNLLSLKEFPYLNTYNPYFYGTAMNIHNLNISAIWRQ